MKILVKKTLSGLIPVSKTEYDKLQECRLKIGETYQIDIKKPRNVKFHRKFFVLINLCFENQENYNNIDHLRHDLIVEAGFYEKVFDLNGIETLRARSMSFAKMDDIEFKELYNRVADVVCRFLSISNEVLAEQVALEF